MVTTVVRRLRLGLGLEVIRSLINTDSAASLNLLVAIDVGSVDGDRSADNVINVHEEVLLFENTACLIIILRGAVIDSTSGRILEWVELAIVVFLNERVELISCYFSSASRIIREGSAKLVDAEAGHISRCYTTYVVNFTHDPGWISWKLGKLNCSQGGRSEVLADGKGWLRSSWDERNLGVRVLLGGAEPAVRNDDRCSVTTVVLRVPWVVVGMGFLFFRFTATIVSWLFSVLVRVMVVVVVGGGRRRLREVRAVMRARVARWLVRWAALAVLARRACWVVGRFEGVTSRTIETLRNCSINIVMAVLC